MRGFSLAVLLVLTITGCSGIPSSGPVHRVQASQSTVTTQLPNFAPPGPQPGADPESLAKGFLRSGLGRRLDMRSLPELRFTHDDFLEDMVYGKSGRTDS